MQYTILQFLWLKKNKFSMKNCYILLSFAQIIDCVYRLEEPHSSFRQFNLIPTIYMYVLKQEQEKKMIQVNPSLTIKRQVRGCVWITWFSVGVGIRLCVVITNLSRVMKKKTFWVFGQVRYRQTRLLSHRRWLEVLASLLLIIPH